MPIPLVVRLPAALLVTWGGAPTGAGPWSWRLAFVNLVLTTVAMMLALVMPDLRSRFAALSGPTQDAAAPIP